MRTNPHPLHSPPGRPINTSCSVLKALHPGVAPAKPYRKQKWDIAPVAQSSPTLPSPQLMTPAIMWKRSARAPPCGSNQDHGRHGILRHTNTATPMANFPPIGIGRRTHWTSMLLSRSRCPNCRRNPRIATCLRNPCMRNLPLPHPLCMCNHPPVTDQRM